MSYYSDYIIEWPASGDLLFPLILFEIFRVMYLAKNNPIFGKEVFEVILDSISFNEVFLLLLSNFKCFISLNPL